MKPDWVKMLFFLVLSFVGASAIYPGVNSTSYSGNHEDSVYDDTPGTFVVNCSVWYRRVIESTDVLRVKSFYPSSAFSHGDFLLLRLHSFSHLVRLTDSYNQTDEPSNYVNGTDLGMVRIVSSEEEELSWHFHSIDDSPTSSNFTVLFRLDLYPSAAPVPGGCNLEFTPTIAPQISTSIVNQVLMEAVFQPAGIIRDTGIQKCVHPFGYSRIQYSIFVLPLSVGDLTFDSYAEALQKMSSTADIRRRGFRVLTLPASGSSDPAFYLPILKTQGMLVAIIAENLDVVNGAERRKDDNFTASYVSTISYGCDITQPSTCYTRYALSTYFVLPALLLLGFISAFLGHHYFRFHLAVYSFLFFAFVTIVIIGDVTQLSLGNTIWFSAGVGCLGAVIMLWFWWYSGIPLPGVVASGLVLGYLLASVLVTIPAVHRFLIDKPAPAQGSVFGIACILPLFFLYYARMVNIVATSICGSYVAMASLDLFLNTSRLSQILWQNILDQVFPERGPLVLRVGPVSTIDAAVISCWVVVATLGIIFQWQREKTNPPFPPHRNLTKSVVDGRLDANPRLRDGPGYPFVRDPLPRIPSDVAHNYRMDWERRNGHRNDFRNSLPASIRRMANYGSIRTSDENRGLRESAVGAGDPSPEGDEARNNRQAYPF